MSTAKYRFASEPKGPTTVAPEPIPVRIDIRPLNSISASWVEGVAVEWNAEVVRCRWEMANGEVIDAWYFSNRLERINP